MKENELMIGDWVVYRGDIKYASPIKIEGMDIRTRALITEDREDVGFDGIDPIPLTAEILEKNGFIAFYEDKSAWRYNGPHDIYRIRIDLDCPRASFVHKDCGSEYNGSIQYVHELQHALRLCGIEKSIEL